MITRIVDLSHTIRAGMVTYPGFPTPEISTYLSYADSRSHYAEGTEFTLATISMMGNTGTYIDSPIHRYEGGVDLAGLRLETLVGLRAEVFHLELSGRAIEVSNLQGRDLQGAAVLLHTGWDAHFGKPEYGVGAPYLSAAATEYLVEHGVALVGIDSVNIDDSESSRERPAHTGLLAAGIHVVEHLTNLASLPAHGAEFTAVPPKIEGFGTFPVRAFAVIR